jgi:hypothetical protein
MLYVIILSVVVLSVIMLSVVMLNVDMLSGVMLSVVKLNVVAPVSYPLILRQSQTFFQIPANNCSHFESRCQILQTGY